MGRGSDSYEFLSGTLVPSENNFYIGNILALFLRPLVHQVLNIVLCVSGTYSYIYFLLTCLLVLFCTWESQEEKPRKRIRVTSSLNEIWAIGWWW
jgi:hypothetical protein